jgi:hypothetical protein
MRQLCVFSIQFPLQTLMDVIMSLVKGPVNSYDKLFPRTGQSLQPVRRFVVHCKRRGIFVTFMKSSYI